MATAKFSTLAASMCFNDIDSCYDCILDCWGDLMFEIPLWDKRKHAVDRCCYRLASRQYLKNLKAFLTSNTMRVHVRVCVCVCLCVRVWVCLCVSVCLCVLGCVACEFDLS